MKKPVRHWAPDQPQRYVCTAAEKKSPAWPSRAKRRKRVEPDWPTELPPVKVGDYAYDGLHARCGAQVWQPSMLGFSVVAEFVIGMSKRGVTCKRCRAEHAKWYRERRAELRREGRAA